MIASRAAPDGGIVEGDGDPCPDRGLDLGAAGLRIEAEDLGRPRREP